MDWIERAFGISPDGGNGMTELAILLVTVVALAVVLAWRFGPVKRRSSGN